MLSGFKYRDKDSASSFTVYSWSRPWLEKKSLFNIMLCWPASQKAWHDMRIGSRDSNVSRPSSNLHRQTAMHMQVIGECGRFAGVTEKGPFKYTLLLCPETAFLKWSRELAELAVPAVQLSPVLSSCDRILLYLSL